MKTQKIELSTSRNYTDFHEKKILPTLVNQEFLSYQDVVERQ